MNIITIHEVSGQRESIGEMLAPLTLNQNLSSSTSSNHLMYSEENLMVTKEFKCRRIFFTLPLKTRFEGKGSISFCLTTSCLLSFRLKWMESYCRYALLRGVCHDMMLKFYALD